MRFFENGQMLSLESIKNDSIELHLGQMQYMELEILIEDMEQELMWNQFIYYCNTGVYPNVADVD